MKRQGSYSDRLILEHQQVEKVVPGGDGLIRNGREVIFVPDVLPGEIVDIGITERKRKFSRGICRRIVKKSEKRIEPLCPLYKDCGGCDFQHMDYEYQVELKTQFARELFRKFARMDLPEDFRFICSPSYAYRQRVQIHSNGTISGFKTKKGDKIVSVKECPVLIPSLNKHLKTLNPASFSGRKLFFGNENGVYSEDDNREFTYSIDGYDFTLKGNLFFQSNAHIISDMIQFALEGQHGDTAMDLYCGVGLFSVFLKEKFHRIIAIEMNPETERFFKKNMRYGEYEYFGMSLEQWLKAGHHKKVGKIDTILVDPPRTGLSKSVRLFLRELSVNHLIYVSCDPATQARDTADLLESGYRVESMRGFDFYPQTHHMETVIRFYR
jgi:23S rRNA (uracil1939-C5)-methyltransferase